jgi:hypothetical protein
LLAFNKALFEFPMSDSQASGAMGRHIQRFLPTLGTPTLLHPGSARQGEYRPVSELMSIAAMPKQCHPRDKIFGCYGLLPELRQRIVVDYSKSPQEVMKSAVRAMVEITCSLGIVCCGKRVGDRSRRNWQTSFKETETEVEIVEIASVPTKSDSHAPPTQPPGSELPETFDSVCGYFGSESRRGA